MSGYGFGAPADLVVDESEQSHHGDHQGHNHSGKDHVPGFSLFVIQCAFQIVVERDVARIVGMEFLEFLGQGGDVFRRQFGQAYADVRVGPVRRFIIGLDRMEKFTPVRVTPRSRVEVLDNSYDGVGSVVTTDGFPAWISGFSPSTDKLFVNDPGISRSIWRKVFSFNATVSGI